MAERDDPEVLRHLVIFLRSQTGLTQAEFGKKARVAQSEVSAYELGRQAPPEEGGGLLGGELIRRAPDGIDVHATRRTSPVHGAEAHAVELADAGERGAGNGRHAHAAAARQPAGLAVARHGPWHPHPGQGFDRHPSRVL